MIEAGAMSRGNRKHRLIRKHFWKLALALPICPCVAKAQLTWDATGSNPGNPVGGSGNWDTTSSANWSNESTDVPWTNGDEAFLSPGAPAGSVITIDDASGTVNVHGIQFNSHYTIAAVPGDTLTIASTGLGIFGTGTISAAIIGTGNLTKTLGTLLLTGHNTYTGFTNISQDGFILGNGASLGNTNIYGYSFATQGTNFAGTNGPGILGATLGGNNETSGNGIGNFSMIDGTIGTFTLRASKNGHCHT
jgi:hypothetical protein